MTLPSVGETHSVRRTFTTDDVEQFAAVSGDDQSIHTERDESGRYVVHGLLTATLPTVVGGDLEVLASHMAFDFHSPVYTGDTVRCDWETTAVEPRPDDAGESTRADITAAVTCVRVGRGGESADTDEETVLTARIEGVVTDG